jgi:hypothetical protein
MVATFDVWLTLTPPPFPEALGSTSSIEGQRGSNPRDCARAIE